MQPIQHSLLLCHSSPPLSIINTNHVRSCGKFSPLVRRLALICFNETTTNEQQITNLDIPALSLRTYVDALILATLVQFLERYGIVIVRVVLDTLLMCVTAVVEQDASTGDSMFGPVVDGTFVVGFGAYDVIATGVVVECPGGDMGKLQYVSFPFLITHSLDRHVEIHPIESPIGCLTYLCVPH